MIELKLGFITQRSPCSPPSRVPQWHQALQKKMWSHAKNVTCSPLPLHGPQPSQPLQPCHGLYMESVCYFDSVRSAACVKLRHLRGSCAPSTFCCLVSSTGDRQTPTERTSGTRPLHQSPLHSGSISIGFVFQYVSHPLPPRKRRAPPPQPPPPLQLPQSSARFQSSRLLIQCSVSFK